MTILFLTPYYRPHVGGVEKHVYEVSKRLKARGERITVITSRHRDNLRNEEIERGIQIVRFTYPAVRFFGLLYIWFWLFKNRNLIEKSHIIHCHDVFVWYLPFRFLYPGKPVYATFHGWEGVYPIPWKNIFLKRLAAKLSWGNICVGSYIEKHYGIKANTISYGGVNDTLLYNSVVKKEKLVVYLGRLEKDTGILRFLKAVKKFKNYRVVFCGDGPLRRECEKYGTVYGFIGPGKFLGKSEYCIPGGYLAAMEAMAYKCKVKVFWSNSLKKDYWEMTPFYKSTVSKDTNSAYNWVKTQTWRSVINQYLNLWNKL